MKKNWSLEEERNYSNWLKEVDHDLIVPLGKKADCADLAYAFRAIYARKEGLPFLAHDKEGNIYGHFSRGWDHLPTHPEWKKDKRFHEFMGDLFRDIVSTRTLHYDTYPIALDTKSIRPGIMVYEDLIAAHVVTIAKISDDTDLPITYYESFIPGHRNFFVSQKNGIHLYEPNIKRQHSGVVYWKKPVKINGVWQYLPEEAMLWFSLEQYEADFPYRNKIGKYLNRLAYEKLHGHTFNKQEFVARVTRELINLFIQRAESLNNNDETLQWLKAKQASSALVRQNSTFDYDQKVHELLDQIWLKLGGYGISRSLFENELDRYAIRIDHEYPAVDSNLILDAFVTRCYSSEPNASLEKRWGIFFDINETQWELRSE